MKVANKQKINGFTIVELLIVIVVIGILAFITIVSFTGISQKAVQASLQSDLTNASTQLKMFFTDKGSYPTANNCSNTLDNEICLKPSPGNSFSYISPVLYYQTYSLLATNNGINYIVTSSSAVTALVAAPFSPVSDWLALPQGDHYGSFYDLVSKTYANVPRSNVKTIYDPNTQHIYDVPANKLSINYRNDGKSGFEAVIEVGRSNYLINSYFNNDSNTDGLADNWSAMGTGTASTTWSRVPGVYKNTAQRWQLTGVAGEFTREMGPISDAKTGFAAGENVTASVWAKSASQGITYKMFIFAYDAAHAYLGNVTTSPTITSSWARYSINYPSLPANTAELKFYVQGYAVDPGDTVDITIDAAQLEKGSFPSSYIPTLLTAVSRSSDMVSLPSAGMSGSVGTAVSVTSSPPYPADNVGFIWTLGSSNASNIRQRYYNQTSLRGESNIGPVVSEAVSGYNTTAFVWSNGNPLIAFKDGVSKVQSATNFAAVTPSYPIRVGAWPDTTPAPLNSSIQRLVFYSTNLSDADVVTASNAVKDGL